jgi:hypothetical protein
MQKFHNISKILALIDKVLKLNALLIPFAKNSKNTNFSKMFVVNFSHQDKNIFPYHILEMLLSNHASL